MAAFAPAPASIRTQASPSPEAPPVTTAFTSLTSMELLLSIDQMIYEMIVSHRFWKMDSFHHSVGDDPFNSPT
jgi:hypothetical protein